MNYLFNFCWLVTCLYQHADAAVTPAQRLDSVPSKDNNGINSPRHSNLGIEQHLLKARQAAPTGVSASVALSLRHSDELYVTTVTLGKDKVNLVVDTGSSDLWTVSSLSNIVQRLGRSSYDVSGGKELANSSFKLQYVDQSGATGKVYVDTVALGDLVIKEQAIEASDSASANMWFRRDYDGIIGFGFSQRNEVKPKKVKTFFDNILPSLSLPLFAVDLRGPGKASSMDIGKIDSTKYSGELVYTAADSSLASWTIVIGGYAIDGDVQKAPFSAIVDTGSALMALPATIAVAYHRAIRSAKWNIPAARWSVDCDATLPDLSLIIGDQLRTMPGSLLKTESSPGSCQSAITPVGQFGEDSPSIGNIFMRSQYIVFASKDEQYWVGFGQKVGSVHTLTQDPGAAAPTSAP